jgi:tetratricopeptide (TPR) repeat protein
VTAVSRKRYAFSRVLSGEGSVRRILVISCLLFAGALSASFAVAQSDDGQTCHRSLDHEEKIAACTRAINSGRWSGANLAWAYTNRGVAFRGRGDDESAIGDYDYAIKLNPNFADAFYNRGLILHDRKEYDRAIADYNRSIAINAKEADVFTARGRSYHEKGDHNRAIEDYNQAIRLDPRYKIAYNNRGVSFEARGERDRAIADYRQAISLDPSYETPRNNLKKLGLDR